jgi:hypothetical protein
LDTDFIRFFERTLIQKSIAFSCVYGPCGSLFMQSKESKKYVLNIYSETEINNILFCSQEYEQNITIDLKQQLETYIKIIDYKNPTKGMSLDLVNKITLRSDFDIFYNDGERYFVVLTRL